MFADQLIHLGNLQFIARQVVEGLMLGRHSSPYHGFSVEFSQHRPYQPGDDLRHIDWRIFGRSDRYYIKQYQEETNLTAYVLLDASQSMAFSSGTVSKFQYARILAASLIYLLVRQNDAAGLALFNQNIRKIYPPKAIVSYANTLLAELQQTQTEGETSIETALHRIAEKLDRKGLVILISDLWADHEAVMKGLKHLRHNGHEILIFHIWDQEELILPQGKKLRFIDLEQQGNVELDVRQIRSEYQKMVSQHINSYKLQCGLLGMDYVTVVSDADLRLILREYLLKRGRLF